jgi:sec-independent protein translocase protein TatA
MFGLGAGELVLIAIIVVVLFASRLPQVGKGVGEAIRNFKKSLGGEPEIDVTPPKGEDGKKEVSGEKKKDA